MLRSRLIVVLALVPTSGALLAACGSSSGGDDKGAITSLINDVSKNPKKVCETSVSTDRYLAANGITRAQCVAASANQKPTTSKIASVTVKGSTATADVSDANSKTVISFVKQGGKWKVDGQKAG